MRMYHFWVQNGSFATNKFFFRKLLIPFSSTCWPLSLSKIFKKILPADPPALWGCAIFGPFPQTRIFFFFQKTWKWALFLSFLSTCQKSKSDINLLVKYWRLKNTEISLAENYNLRTGFFLSVLFLKNVHLTQIPDKSNDEIFLKSTKTMFLVYFWPFLVIFARWGFLPKNPALLHTTIYGSLTPC